MKTWPHLTDMDDIYKNMEEYNLNKKHRILIVFYDIIPDMVSNKKLNPTVAELFISDISFIFVTQSYFAVPKIFG